MQNDNFKCMIEKDLQIRPFSYVKESGEGMNDEVNICWKIQRNRWKW